MADSTLATFQKALETARRDLDRFAKDYQDVPYRYYHAKPPAPVPDDVWRFLAEEYECVAYEALDIFPDRTAILRWEKENLDATKFKLLCRQCCVALWKHADLLETVAEVRTVVTTPPGYQQWIRAIHAIAGINKVWSGLVNKCLVVSQRPFDETKTARDIEWARYITSSESHAVVPPTEPDEREEQLVRTLREQRIPVPDVWFEHIPGPVARFHSQTLRTLEDLVPCNCPRHEQPQVRPVAQPPSSSTTAETAGRKMEIPCLVTLRQVAPLVGRSKRTLENYVKEMPPARVAGKTGSTHCWDWRELRPWLEDTFNVTLPERFPDQIPPRSS
jgi:hypothetical protein